ncbi:MAG: DivIVA domain-containing protein [Abditibacteriales bacterium]|nr:DivIVA domain-containing protein [Abditibacteriales bacterium]MDW8364765.1 DivIVA domain-containing protein [Abditibacteriales bacterium]
MYRNGQYEQAIPLLKQAHAENPEDFFIMVHLGVAYYGAGLYSAAVAIFEKARQVNDQNPDLHYNLGNSYLAIQDWDKAREAFTAALRVDPTYVEAERALAKLAELQRNLSPAEGDTPASPPQASPPSQAQPKSALPTFTKSVLLSPYCQAVLANPSAVLHHVGRSGYQADEVENVLFELREYINTIVPQVTKVMGDLERAEVQIAYYKKMEQSIADALISAQKTAEDIKAEARARAQGIVTEAEEHAARLAQAAEEVRHTAEQERERILDEAQQRALQLTQEAEALRAQAQQQAQALLAEAETKAQHIHAAAEAAERQARERAAATLREADEEAYRILQDAEEQKATAEQEAAACRALAEQEAEQLRQQAYADATQIIADAQNQAQHIIADADHIRRQAQQEAERIRADAEAQAQALIQEAHSEVQHWRAIISDLQAQKQKVEQEWFALTNSFLARLQQEQQNLRMERRREPRCQVRINVTVIPDNAQPIAARSHDLSAHGLQLISDQNLAVGTPLQLMIEIPDSEQPIHCTGRVRWANALDDGGKSAFRLGVALTNLEEEDGQRLSAFLHTLTPPVNI